jgi:hypothetical protein
VGAWIQDASRGIVAGVSFNGGDTWQSVVIPGISLCSGGIYGAAADPWVSFAPNGDVYISSIENPGADKRARAVLVNKSTDGGLTWSGPTSIVVATNDYVDKESITADPTNPQFVYATWTRFSSSTSKGTTMFARTTDGGQTWEPAREIFDSGSRNNERGQQIVVLSDGTLVNFFTHLLFKNDAGGVEHYDLQLSLLRSTDRGQTWLPAEEPIVVANMLALGDTYGIPGIGGVPNPDGGLGTQSPGFFFDVAIDPANGNLYAVWQDARFSNFQYTSIAFAMSTDGGFTWSTPIKINQTPDNIPIGNQQAFLPSVAVNQDGVVAVTYYDFRNNTPDPGLPTDVWMVHAHPASGLTNPASWSSENRLTTTSFEDEVPAPGPDGYFVGDYEGLVAEGRNFGAFWAMPPIGGGINDQDSIVFRNALPATATAAGAIDQGLGQISINDVALAEGHSGFTAFVFTVTLSTASSKPVTVQYATADGTATAGQDYVATAGTLTFAADETTQTITVQVKGDKIKEGDETFFVNLNAASNGVLLDSQGLGTIVSDDGR